MVTEFFPFINSVYIRVFGRESRVSPGFFVLNFSNQDSVKWV